MELSKTYRQAQVYRYPENLAPSLWLFQNCQIFCKNSKTEWPQFVQFYGCFWLRRQWSHHVSFDYARGQRIVWLSVEAYSSPLTRTSRNSAIMSDRRHLEYTLINSAGSRMTHQFLISYSDLQSCTGQQQYLADLFPHGLRLWSYDRMAVYKFDHYAPTEGALSDDAVWRLSDVCRVHQDAGRRVRPAGWMARIGWSGPARPASLKDAAARFRCSPGRGISWRPPAYSLLLLL